MRTAGAPGVGFQKSCQCSFSDQMLKFFNLSRDACVRLRLARRCAELAACGAKSRPPTSHRIGLGRVGRSDVSPGYGCLEKALPPDLWREEFGDQVFVIRTQLGQIRLHFALRIKVIGIERARPT